MRKHGISRKQISSSGDEDDQSSDKDNDSDEDANDDLSAGKCKATDGNLSLSDLTLSGWFGCIDLVY